NQRRSGRERVEAAQPCAEQGGGRALAGAGDLAAEGQRRGEVDVGGQRAQVVAAAAPAPCQIGQRRGRAHARAAAQLDQRPVARQLLGHVDRVDRARGGLGRGRGDLGVGGAALGGQKRRAPDLDPGRRGRVALLGRRGGAAEGGAGSRSDAIDGLDGGGGQVQGRAGGGAGARGRVGDHLPG